MRLEGGPPLLHLASPENDVAWSNGRLEVGDDSLDVVAVEGKERIILVQLFRGLPSAIRHFELHCFGVEVEGESAHIAEELAQYAD